MVDLALKMLLHDRLRAAMTVAGVGFSVALALVQTGLFLGAMDNASTMIEHARADLWVTSHHVANVDFAQTIPAETVERVREVPGVARADNLIVSYVTIALPSGSEELLEVYAMSDFREWGIPWEVRRGNLDDLRRGPFIFLDQSANRRYGPFHVGQDRELLGRRFRIVGRTAGAISFTTTPIAFMDIHHLRDLQPDQLLGRTDYVLVRLAPGADAAAVSAALRRRLPYDDVLTRAEWAARSRRYWIVSTGLGLNMYITLLLGALVGVAIVAQTLYAATLEHLREFGTVKAIGGANRDIYRILAEQAVLVAVAGFALGEVPAWALPPVLHRVGLKLLVPAGVHAAAAAGAVVLCLSAAMISFHKVARLDPALVFRT